MARRTTCTSCTLRNPKFGGIDLRLPISVAPDRARFRGPAPPPIPDPASFIEPATLAILAAARCESGASRVTTHAGRSKRRLLTATVIRSEARSAGHGSNERTSAGSQRTPPPGHPSQPLGNLPAPWSPPPSPPSRRASDVGRLSRERAARGASADHENPRLGSPVQVVCATSETQHGAVTVACASQPVDAVRLAQHASWNQKIAGQGTQVPHVALISYQGLGAEVSHGKGDWVSLGEFEKYLA
jgi:hypothetical protein